MPLDDCRNLAIKITAQSFLQLTTVVATTVNFLLRSKRHAVVAQYINVNQPHKTRLRYLHQSRPLRVT